MFTFGTDPEFFLKQNDKYVSAIGKINGTKEVPDILQNGAGLQYDNVALEFASPICIDITGVVNSLRETFNLIKNKIPGITMDCTPSAFFPPEELTNEKAQEFGCSPDYNVWERKVNEPPTPLDPTFRSCGGHVHLGATEDSPYNFLLNLEGKENTIKAMDITLGLTSVVLDSSEEAIKRKSLYGKAGCFRPKEYGVEYRTLSNFWLKSPKLVELIYSLSKDALDLVRGGKITKAINNLGKDFIITSINIGPKEGVNYIQTIAPYISEQSRVLLLEIVNKEFSFESEWI